ncbi:hypothetical protein PENTCL1PPCAC_17945, partial [Pristionchus entomophagus]
RVVEMVKGAKGLSDPRFAHLKNDPKFGGLKRKERKVVVEDRFAGVLTDGRFTRAPIVDKRGRKVKRTGDVTLHRLYEVEEKKKEEEETRKRDEEDMEDEDASEQEEGEEDDNAPLKYDLARGDGEYVSSSDEDEEEEEDGDEDEEKAQVDHDWGNLDKDARRVEWASRRLAICNLDWDSLSSQDLFLLFSCFKSLGGHVESLSIYLSDMGKEKLEKEEKDGPQLIVNENGDDDSSDEDDGRLDEGTLKHDNAKREAIRKYQMERLKYYYAVLVCDSEQTASAVYENCDGVEYENSGLRLDLRFVPDEMTFEDDRLKEKVTADDVDSSKYKPREVSNVAAATTKVKLTWEESDVNRTRKMRGAFDEDADLDAVSSDLIAPSSGEEDNDDDDREGEERILTKKERLAILLGGGDKDDEDMEVEWEKEEENEIQEKKVKKKFKSSWEEYLDKRKAKRKEKKAMAKAERRKAREEREQEEEDRRMEKKKVVKKDDEKEKDSGDIQVDPRFNALFTHSAFSIDTASNLNKSKGLVMKQNAARRKRKAEIEMETPSGDGHNDLITKLKNKSAKWSS